MHEVNDDLNTHISLPQQFQLTPNHAKYEFLTLTPETIDLTDLSLFQPFQPAQLKVDYTSQDRENSNITPIVIH